MYVRMHVRVRCNIMFYSYHRNLQYILDVRNRVLNVKCILCYFQIEFNAYFNKASLVTAIKAFGEPQPSSMTNIVGAIKEMHAKFNVDPRKDDLNVRLVGIVITDGAQNYPSGSEATALADIGKAANLAIADGITMISIGKRYRA